MRTATFVLLSSALMAVGLSVTAPPLPTTAASITSLTLPSEVYAGERIGVRASVLLPDPEALERRFRLCHVESGACTTAGWGSIATDGHWVGFAGNPTARDEGTHHASWTLYAPWGVDAYRAAERVAVEMHSRAAPE